MQLILILPDCQIRGSIVVSISACHAEDPGSIPGRGACIWQRGTFAAAPEALQARAQLRGSMGFAPHRPNPPPFHLKAFMLRGSQEKGQDWERVWARARMTISMMTRTRAEGRTNRGIGQGKGDFGHEGAWSTCPEGKKLPQAKPPKLVQKTLGRFYFFPFFVVFFGGGRSSGSSPPFGPNPLKRRRLASPGFFF